VDRKARYAGSTSGTVNAKVTNLEDVVVADFCREKYGEYGCSHVFFINRRHFKGLTDKYHEDIRSRNG
jgi:hypothetical protein